MKFSVIIPVYNVEKFLSKCLDSVFSQNFDDFEVIAINDGSKDNSAKILEEYSSNNDKVRIFHQPNMGLGATRNNAIKIAKGEYLVFVDSDDYIRADMLSTLNYYLTANNLDILSFNCCKVDINGNSFQNNINSDGKYTDLTKKEFLLKEPTVCTKVYRKHLFVDNNIFFPDRLWYEDLATVFRLVPHCKKIGHLNENLYFYVQQPGSITHSEFTPKMLDIIDSFELLYNHYKINGFLEAYFAELEWNGILHVVYYSSFRLLTKKFRRKEMLNLCSYLMKKFPDYKSNSHYKNELNSRYMLKDVAEKRFFYFYYKNCLRIKLVLFYRKLFKSDTRG